MENVLRLYDVLGRWKKYYLLAGGLLVLSSFLQMLQPKVIQVAIDSIIAHLGQGNTSNQEVDRVAQFFFSFLQQDSDAPFSKILLIIGLMFIILALLRAFTHFLSGALTASSTENAIRQLRNRLFSHIQALPMKTLDQQASGDMIQRCTGDVTTVRNFIATQITEVIGLIALFVGALFMMLSVHVWYALVSVMLVPLILMTAFYFFKKEAVVWQEHEKEQDKLTAIIQENLNGIRVVQAFSREDYEIDKFARQNVVKRKIGLVHVDLHKWFWTYSDLLINLQISISLLAGGYFALQQQITIGEFVSFFTYAVAVTWPMRQIGRIVTQTGMAAVAMERMSDILNLAEENYEGYVPQEALKGSIEFRKVSFKYNEADPLPALHEVSFNVEAGQTVALMGDAGSGKSTIIALLSRFYEPDAGVILLDGKPLNEYSKYELRNRLGIVHQKPFLFSTTIQENIAFTQPEVALDTVKAYAELAAVDDFIGKLPDGYATKVGERGVTLSGGQKQRVALARTLLSQPELLILDDATSAVDTETEYRIQQGLKTIMDNKTTLVVAHRLTAVQYADKVIVLQKGKITEQGSPAALLKQDGFYQKTYALQLKVEEDIQREFQ
ncbi:MAG: ABC transporter ATP-binding protein [Bacteroidota bacterium]